MPNKNGVDSGGLDIKQWVRDLMDDEEGFRPYHRAWTRQLMDGPGGLKAYHRREIVIGRPTIYQAVEFTLRALANPRCEGSQEVLDAIIAQRARANR